MRLKKHARFAMALFVVTAFSVGAAVVIGSRQPAVKKESATASAKETPAVETVKTPTKRAAKPVSSKTTTARPAATKTTAAKATSAGMKSKTVAASEPIAARPVTTKAGAEHQSEVAVEAMTITGCLERDKDTFRLKDTDAPTARSWKSGFLKKSSKVQVVDGSNRLKLGNHVGHRLAITGLLKDRQFEARSFKLVGPSC